MVINSINNHNTNKLSITIITDYIIFIFMMMIIINANSSHKRRKCRSQTSDTMDRWNSRGGKSQRRKRRKNIREEKSQKKEDAGGRKVRRVANHCVFPVTWLVGSEGWKVGSLKTAGAEPSVQMPSGQMRDEKLHAFVARSTCRSQTVQTTPGSDHFWKLRCRKSAHHGGAKHMLKSKCTKHRMYAPLLDVEASFGVAGARDCAPCQKWAKREGFAEFPKTMAGVRHLKRWIFRGRRSTRDMLIRDVRRSGRWFPERGCILEHQIFRLAKMLSHSVWPGITFSWQAP